MMNVLLDNDSEKKDSSENLNYGEANSTKHVTNDCQSFMTLRNRELKNLKTT